MYVTSDQPRIILVCFFIGVIIGLYYEFFYFIKLFIKSSAIKHIINAIWLVSSTPLYVIVSTKYHFENLRAYMILSLFFVLLLYFFSLHKCIAFFTNKVYNVIIKLFTRVKGFYDRFKKEKGVLGSSFGANNACVYSSNFRSLSSGGNRYEKKRNKKAR